MNSNDPRSSDFSYKKYSLEQLDNWVNDALSCEDLTPEDIYNTIVKCVNDSVEYHKKNLTKSVELLSLLKGHRPVEIDTSLDDVNGWDYDAAGGKFPRPTKKDWVDFWEETYYPEEHKQYTEEEMNAMCDAAEEKEKERCREYNLREAEYYTKRAELDARHSEHWTNPGRNKTYDQMVAEGWTMTADGFWIKETDKGVASVSAKPDPYLETVKAAGGYEWTPKA